MSRDWFKGMKRFLQVMALFVTIFWAFFSLRYQRLWHSRQWIRARREQLYIKEAVRFRTTAIEMGGLLIKLGQFFSTRVDVLPPSVIRELEGLQDEVKSVEYSAIRQVIEEAFQCPVTEVFEKIEELPVAAASLGQVHRAFLPGGQVVAIKVLRPGIQKIVRVDLKAIGRVIQLLKIFTDWGRVFDLDVIYREFSETIWNELDYIKEGQNAEAIARNSQENDQLLVPQIYWEQTTHQVLTMEFMNGIKISNYAELDRCGVDRKELSRLLVSVYCQQVLTDGFFHADPHPGNLFVTEEGRLIMVDFGMVGLVSPMLKKQLLDMAIAVVQKQYIQVAEYLKEMGLLQSYADSQMVARTLGAVLERFLGGGTRIDDLALVKLLEDIEQLVYEQPFQIPGSYTFLGRAAGTLYGLCSGLDPEVNFLEAMQPYLDDFVGGKKGVFAKVKEQGEEILRSVLTVPPLAARVLQQAEQGELTVRIPLNPLLEASRENARALKMLSWAVVFGFLLLSSVYLLVHGLSDWAYAGFILSILVFLIMLKQRSSSRRMKHPGMIPRKR